MSYETELVGISIEEYFVVFAKSLKSCDSPFLLIEEAINRKSPEVRYATQQLIPCVCYCLFVENLSNYHISYKIIPRI